MKNMHESILKSLFSKTTSFKAGDGNSSQTALVSFLNRCRNREPPEVQELYIQS